MVSTLTCGELPSPAQIFSAGSVSPGMGSGRSTAPERRPIYPPATSSSAGVDPGRGSLDQLIQPRPPSASRARPGRPGHLRQVELKRSGLTVISADGIEIQDKRDDEDILALLNGSRLSPWHLVSVPRSDEESPPLLLPDGVRGIIVTGDLADRQSLVPFVEEVCQERSHIPVLVLLHDSSCSTIAECHSSVLEVQDQLHAAGADDVLLRPPAGAADGGEQLRLALAMCARRVERRREEHAILLKRVQELQRDLNHQPARARQTQQGQGQAQGPQHNKLFWSCVHRIMDGFPKIEPHVTSEELGTGDRVGRCVLGEIIGEGAFGSVFEATHQETGETLAIKVLTKTKIQDLAQTRNIWREFTLLQKLRHPGIVQLLGVAHTRHQICIQMEFAGQTTLHDAITATAPRNLQNEDVWDILGQVATALHYCHRVGVAHRDVKHENIALKEDPSMPRETSAKLIDFGLALEVSKARAETPCGTMPFAAPEILKGLRPGCQFNCDLRACDVWAHGVCVLDALCGLGQINRLLGWPKNTTQSAERGDELFAFFARDRGALEADLAAALRERCVEETGEAPPRDPALLSNMALLELLLGAFQVDPSCRWTMEEVNEWMQEQGEVDD